MFIFQELDQEEQKFALTLEKGLREFQKIAVNSDVISGKDAFLLFQSYGFPLEMTQELAAEQNISVDEAIFKEEFEKNMDYNETLKICHSTVGVAILNTSITIVFGFSILVFSKFIPTIYFGVFTGIAMLLAMISVLTLLPSLILINRPFGK